MATVFHYTSFDSALQILLSGAIKMGNIKNSNDQVEIDNLPPDGKENYFIFCTSEKGIDSLMWFAYAKNRFGSCIAFNLKKKKRKQALLCKNKNAGLWHTGNVKYDLASKYEVGFIKDIVFKREKEYRYLCKSSQPNVFAKINWDIVENVTLILSPFFKKEIIEPIFKDVPVKVNVDIQNYFNC